MEELAPEDSCAYEICMQNTCNYNCFSEGNIAFRKITETSPVKEENKELLEINYLTPTGKLKKSRTMRFSTEEKRMFG